MVAPPYTNPEDAGLVEHAGRVTVRNVGAGAQLSGHAGCAVDRLAGCCVRPWISNRT